MTSAAASPTINQMHGLNILQRTLSTPTLKGKSALWQYHPRSDHHSKVACWGILFDMFLSSALLRQHVEEGRVAFGINHEMRDFRTNRKKNLDLVLCRPAAGHIKSPLTFRSLVAKWGILLTAEERALLESMPDAIQQPVASVTVALEAKACMTEHMKARPRLFDELNSSHDVVHGAAEMAIAAGFVMINIAERFVSPELNKSGEEIRTTLHKQPRVTELVIEKIREIPRRATTSAFGFDAVAIVVVDCTNDAISPVRVVDGPPAPQRGETDHYDSMISRVLQLYESRFPHS